MSFDHEPPSHEGSLSEDSIQEMLILATRLRERAGGELDDAAILAVAEATGAPIDYVRLAVRAIPARLEKKTPFDDWKSSYLAFDPEKRKYVASAVMGLGGGFFYFLQLWRGDRSGFLILLVAMTALGSLYNSMIARPQRVSLLTGAIYGLVGPLSTAFFIFLLSLFIGVSAAPAGPGAEMFIGLGLLFALFGLAANVAFEHFRQPLGIKDPVNDRQEMLQELLKIQERLKSDEQVVTFLSVDIVGSTRLKVDHDPLAVEFTFNEYHRYVEAITTRNGGQVHSTAGDGVTCVFQDASLAYKAGKAILAGLFEFNGFRNKLGKNIEIRGGIHTGSVLAPGRELVNVNFAHVIDVAAHMQKLAPVGTLAVSEETAKHLPGGLAGVSEETIVAQDFVAAIWKPRTSRIPQIPVPSLPRAEESR